MARSKRIDDAVARVFSTKDKEYSERLDAFISALDIISNEIKDSFNPYTEAEVPFILYSLKSIYDTLYEKYPKAARFSDQFSAVFGMCSVEVRVKRSGVDNV